MEKGGNVSFNYTFDLFYIRLYDIGHIVKDHSDNTKNGNPSPPLELDMLFK